MKIFFKILFGFGLISYLISSYFFYSCKCEIFSDIGNGIMLTNTVLILVYIIQSKEKN